ncbi:hypothetical protein [Peribacillus glennii]|uniref:Uncharacterized protein n=1 Tax=Peribacillus glennii TaxID=2303991 RepID=A0A372L9H1_9BACI|nr:hypothetical protein [Peribacillus glennii]RFU61219.1 hypothetical protein D0466_18555 [Peribacillus glennii]
MRIESVIHNIKKACDKNEFSNARATIDKQWNRVTEPKNYLYLNENAKQFVKIMKDEKRKR